MLAVKYYVVMWSLTCNYISHCEILGKTHSEMCVCVCVCVCVWCVGVIVLCVVCERWCCVFVCVVVVWLCVCVCVCVCVLFGSDVVVCCLAVMWLCVVWLCVWQ